MKKMITKKTKALLALALGASLILTACGGNGGGTATSTGEKAESNNVIKIASVSPLSGSQSAAGEAIKFGAQLALEDKKAEFEKLGFKLELAPQDDQADPKVGVSVAKRLITDDDVFGVVGHYNSGVAVPASQEYNKKSLAMVSPANTSPEITDRKLPTVNRICSRDDIQGPAGANFAKDVLKVQTTFVIHDKTKYGQGLADQFKAEAEKLGIKVAGYEGITAGEVDFSAVMNLVSNAKPDLVYFGGMYPEAGILIKQAREKGITAKFMGGDGIDSAELVKIAGEAITSGVYYTTVAGDVTKTAEGKAWAEKYQAKFGKKHEGFAAYGYDSMGVMLKGVENAISANGGKKPTREQVAAEVRKLKDFQGIVTTVSFDEKGDNLNAKIFIYEFKAAAYPATLVGEK